MQKIKKINKRGQTANLVLGTIMALGIGVFVLFALLFGIASLDPDSFFTAGSQEQVAVTSFTQNYTDSVSEFSGQLPTVGLILGVLLIIGALVIMIVLISRFRSGAGTTGGL